MAADGVELATAWIRLVPTVEGIQETITKEVGGPEIERAGDKAGKGFGSRFKAAAGPLVAILGGAALAKGVADFVSESLTSLGRIETINAQTATVIESTGSAAGVSAQHVEQLAGSLEALTATEAESVQEGANMLLTFKNIQNGVGEGNQIFDDATTALVDMSRAMGSDPKTAAIQLGKALNDPIAGISALSRVGIQFTDDQKALIQSLVDSGQTMEAQKIILGELNSQFGGSGAAYAETYAGKIELLGHAWGTFGETLLAGAIPAMSGAIGWLTDLINAGTGVINIFANGDFDSGLFAAFGVTEDSGFVDFLFDVREGIGELWTAIGPLVTEIAKLWMQFSPLSMIFQIIQPLLPQLATLFSTLFAAIMPILEALGAALMPILEALIPIITQVLAAFMPLIMALVEALAPILTTVANIVAAILVPVLDTLVTIITWLAEMISWAVSNVIAPLFEGVLIPIITAVGENFEAAFGGLGDFFAGLWQGIEDGFIGFVNFIIDGINGFLSGLNEMGNFLSDVTGGAVSFEVGSIPRLAEGATIMPRPGGTLAVLAEAGRPESVVDTGLINRALEQGIEGSGTSGKRVQVEATFQQMDPTTAIRLMSQEIAFATEGP